MKKIALNLFAFGLLVFTTQTANAQNAVLAEMYGRGVHAYYAGMMDESLEYLTMAIDNQIEDPRAYYFRGMVYNVTGRPDQAESDWKTGAKMEAAGRVNKSIGRSLARLQGSARLKLESIRQNAKLVALAEAMKRSNERYGELDAAGRAASTPVAPVPPSGAPNIVAPVPPTGPTNPFADDMAAGKPEVVADDAFAGALEDPFAGETPAGAGGAAAPAGNPFGGGAGAGGDPFGGAGGGGADPFGGAGGGGAGGGGGADPFGGAGGDAGGADPFGGAGGGAGDAGGADPFGGGGADPFGT